jgi:photosystem II stability/assembly factor-like uncharacterized protein
VKHHLWLLFLIIFTLSACVLPSTGTPAPAATGTPVPQQGAGITLTVTPTAAGPTATPAGDPVAISRIDIMDTSGSGWGIGRGTTDTYDRVLRTSDGGVTWLDVTPAQPVSFPDGSSSSALPAFMDLQHTWVIYYNPMPAPVGADIQVWYTADGGKSWQPSQALDLSMTLEFFLPTDLGFSDLQNGWLLAHLGAGMNHDYVALYKTSNGGQSWQRVVDPSMDGTSPNSLPMSCQKTGVAFQDPMNGWVTGGCNGVMPGLFLYKTSDGGINWYPVQLPNPPSAPTLLTEDTNFCTTQPPSFPAPQQIYMEVQCMTSDGQNRALLYASQDGGSTWTSQDLPGAFAVTDFLSNGVGWWLGGSTRDTSEPKVLMQTTDGGKTWTPQLKQMNWNGQIDFVDQNNGWAVARGGDILHLLKTNNAGKLWVEVKPVRLR